MFLYPAANCVSLLGYSGVQATGQGSFTASMVHSSRALQETALPSLPPPNTFKEPSTIWKASKALYHKWYLWSWQHLSCHHSEAQNVLIWKNEKNHHCVTPHEIIALKESWWMLEALSERTNGIQVVPGLPQISCLGQERSLVTQCSNLASWITGQMALMHHQVHRITYEINMFCPILTKFWDLTWFSGNTRGRGKQGTDQSLKMGVLMTTRRSLKSAVAKSRG